MRWAGLPFVILSTFTCVMLRVLCGQIYYTHTLSVESGAYSAHLGPTYASVVLRTGRSNGGHCVCLRSSPPSLCYTVVRTCTNQWCMDNTRTQLRRQLWGWRLFWGGGGLLALVSGILDGGFVIRFN